MKRFFALLLALCVFLPLVACGELTPIEKCQQKAGNTATNLRGYDDFITGFKALVSKMPEFTLLQLNDARLDDGTLTHVFHIKDSLFDDLYRLQVDANPAGKITWVFLSTERESYGNLQFAVFSLYAYESMGFPKVDPNAFYEKYDLYSNGDVFEYDICGAYEVTSMTIANEVTFSIKC